MNVLMYYYLQLKSRILNIKVCPNHHLYRQKYVRMSFMFYEIVPKIPLVCGYQGVVLLFSIFNHFHVWVKRSDKKFVSRSVNIDSGMPKVHTSVSTKA